MATFIKVFKKSDLGPGKKKSIFISGKRIMVANVAGEFFAMDDMCTHAGCSLGSEGSLDGSIVTCGCHGGQFDVKTGKVVALPPEIDEKIYDVKIEGDDVLVNI